MASFVLRGIDIILGFITLPLALKYLDPLQFGLFATLLSIVEWFTYFDIGLNHGLRNKFTEAVVVHDDTLAKTYVSTAYFVLGLIACFIFVLFYIFHRFLDWASILNAPAAMGPELRVLAIIVFAVFSLRFVVNLINCIFYGLQTPAVIDVMNVIRKVVWIAAIIVLINVSRSSLLYFGATNSMTLLLIPLIFSIFYFGFRKPEYAPSVKFIKIKYAKMLASLGTKFFIIQISSVVILATNNILIAQFAGPVSVTSYNIAFKYFGFLNMLFTIILTPLWSAYTEAYKKGDFQWIKGTISDMVKIWYILCGITFVMVLFSRPIIRIWIGPSVDVPLAISGLVAVLMVLTSWVSIFNYFINGTSKLKLQMFMTIIGGVLNIPLSIFLATYCHLGASGIILGSILSLSLNAISSPIQAVKILRKQDNGIWGA